MTPNRRPVQPEKQTGMSMETQIALIAQDVAYTKDKVDHIDDKVSQHYVSKEEFEPIKRVVYGLVGLILVAVVGALLALVVKQ